MDISIANDKPRMMPSADKQMTSFDPKPLLETGRKWSRWLGPVISLAMLVAIVMRLSTLNMSKIWVLVPVSPLFWMIFILSYFIGPSSEWIIFRRLWNIPISGFFALIRKQITNALLPSYSGEVAFYAWARKRTEITGAPFGAIKDVAILSALTGNLFTLAMLAAAFPLFGSLLGNERFGAQVYTFALSIGFVTLSSLIMMIFGGRIFGLPRKDMWFVAAIMVIRTLTGVFSLGLLWHLAMPSVELGWWLLLATIKLLLSRLPFVPNQDLLFASVTVFLIGHDQASISDLIFMIAGLTVILHIVFGVILGTVDLFQSGVKSDA